MAQLIIDSGPVDATDSLREVPESKWFELMQVRRDFLGVHLPYDCRRLLEFVEDAEQMHGPLGFVSADDFIQRGLQLEPQQVAWAVDGLRRMKPDEPIPYAKAVALGQHGRPKENNKNLVIQGLKYGTRAHWLARLDRDGHTELAAQVRAHKLSANAAAIKAGYRKSLSTLQQIQKLWVKLDRDERMAHLQWTLKHCATCGREGVWTDKDDHGNPIDVPDGMWCDDCCSEGAAASYEEEK